MRGCASVPSESRRAALFASDPGRVRPQQPPPETECCSTTSAPSTRAVLNRTLLAWTPAKRAALLPDSDARLTLSDPAAESWPQSS